MQVQVQPRAPDRKQKTVRYASATHYPPTTHYAQAMHKPWAPNSHHLPPTPVHSCYFCLARSAFVRVVSGICICMDDHLPAEFHCYSG